MFLWRKFAEAGWVNAREELLQAHARGELVIVRAPGRKLLQVEIACRSVKAADKLVAVFGGSIEKLPSNWLQRFTLDDSKPIKIGKRLIVTRPPKEQPGSTARTSGPRILLIPASTAFGTGEHATTAMSLRLLEELTRPWKRGWSVVDLGTGTGILALAASLFGAGSVLALDTDPAAISMAKSNARLNKIRGVTFQRADACKRKSSLVSQVTIANLYSELLIKILPTLKYCDWLILSGILRIQESEFLDALRRNKIEIVRMRRRGKWLAILARNRHALQKDFLRRWQTTATVKTNAK